MSDTTTITPEERAAWREWLESPISCHDAPHRAFTLRLLTALETAEARADELHTYIGKLVYALTDGKLSKPYDISVITDEVESIYQEHIRDAVAEAEAERDRLRAERDWLAGSMAEDGCPYLAFWADFEEDMRPDWCICTDTADDGFDCTGDPKECWQQEAARRAVAAGEGE